MDNKFVLGVIGIITAGVCYIVKKGIDIDKTSGAAEERKERRAEQRAVEKAKNEYLIRSYNSGEIQDIIAMEKIKADIQTAHAAEAMASAKEASAQAAARTTIVNNSNN